MNSKSSVGLGKYSLVHQYKSNNHFEFVAPDHMVMAISPLPGHEMIHWSLLNFVPTNVQIWNSDVGDRPTYFVQSAFGSGSMNFSLDIQVGLSKSFHLKIKNVFDLRLTPDWTQWLRHSISPLWDITIISANMKRLSSKSSKKVSRVGHI